MSYYCTNCGNEFLKWSGKCGSCGQWDTLAESPNQDIPKGKGSSSKSAVPAKVVTLSDLEKDFKNGSNPRISTTFAEFDRVLGGGIVPGSITLVTGEPGIGKSTILLQIALNLSKSIDVLYISGEESVSQVYSRVLRISKKDAYSDLLSISDETNLESITELILEKKPDLTIIDSIQSLESSLVKSASGSMGQVRVCGSTLTKVAKSSGVPIIIVGQINKEGSVAGPKVLEHVVDTVLHFEGGEFNTFRLLRSVKNRFGSTNEIGVFEMGEGGLSEISNPSELFFGSQRGLSGTAIGAVIQGSRVVFVEVQALVNERGMESGPLRRVANGIKKPRLDMLCAVMSKRGKVFLGDKDVFVNIVGGVNVDNPSIDLAVCCAIKSAVSDSAVDSRSVYWGEVGLTGEVRGLFGSEMVQKETARLGYKQINMPSSGKNLSIKSLKVRPLSSISSL